MGLWQILVWVFLILYVLSSFDFLPDVLPVLGWLDDLLVIVGAYWYMTQWRARAQAASGDAWGGNDRGSRSQDAHQRQERSQRAHQDIGAANPWDVLQITPQASAQEIAAAYKAQLLKYHPDRVAHLGDEFQRLAHRKTLEIQQAYTKLKRRSA